MGDAAAFPWFLYIVNPSVNPPYGDCQLPVKGSLLGVFTSSHFSLPHRGRWILRSKRRREFACLGRGGGCEQSEQTEGLKKKGASHGNLNPQSIRLAAYCQPKNPLAISKRFLSAFIPKTDEKSAIMLEQSENMNLAERSL